MLHETAIRRLQLDSVKNQNEEMEKKHSEDIAVVREKNDDLQKTIKLKEETLTEPILQYNEQLNVLTAEAKILTSELGSEKQNKERLETEVESCRSRLATALHDPEQSQKSERDAQLAFQGARDEWFGLCDKMNFDMSTLNDKIMILSQRLSKAESKLSSLETDFNHKRDAPREKSLVLEYVHRELSQTQHQEEETEHTYQSAEGKVNACIRKLASLEERCSHLERENMLLRQQLDDAHQKSHNHEKKAVTIQDQLQDIMKILQAQNEKVYRMLEERNESINEVNHLKQRLYQLGKVKAEKEVSI